MNLHVSPSKLERFRLYVTEAYQGSITKEKVIETIKGEQAGSEAMDLGTAIHAIIEHGPERFLDNEVYRVFLDNMTAEVVLQPSEVEEAIKLHNLYPDMVHEMPILYEVNGVKIRMRIDGMNGLDVHEHKTTSSTVSRENYEDSLQWRIYLLATKGRLVQYNVFAFSSPKEGPRKCTPHVFNFLPYPGMDREVKNWIERFVLFCENEGLMEYIDYDLMADPPSDDEYSS